MTGKKYENALPSGTILKGGSYTYVLEEVLGQGTFGITYLASVRDGNCGKSSAYNLKVTIKEFFLKGMSGRSGTTVTFGSRSGICFDYRRKFIREAHHLSKIHNSHVVQVLEAFEANDTAYYSMQYISGGSLDEYIANKGGLTQNVTVSLAMQVADALEYLHANKMLHLDLKPSNIMLNGQGDAVLIDFGLSKQYDDGGDPETSTTVGRGTQGYAPLEQESYREGQSFPVTMDIYALGGTMFKMLTGRRPDNASVILNDGFPRNELLGMGVESCLVNLIERMMAPLKKDRPQTVSQVKNLLSDVKRTLPVELNPLDDEDVTYVELDDDDDMSLSFLELSPETTRLIFRYQADPSKEYHLEWFEVDISERSLAVSLKYIDDHFGNKYHKLCNADIYRSLIRRVNSSSLELTNRPYASAHGISVKAYIGQRCYLAASSFTQDGEWSGLRYGNVLMALRDYVANIADIKEVDTKYTPGLLGRLKKLKNIF